MATINFTAEDRKELMELAGEALVSGATFRGAVGSTMNIYDLFHNTNVTTLQRILKNTKKEIEETENSDRWSMNEYQKRKLSRLQKEYKIVDLIIGYRKKEDEEAAAKATVKELNAQLAELKESVMTPEARIAALEAKIKAAGGTVNTETVTQ